MLWLPVVIACLVSCSSADGADQETYSAPVTAAPNPVTSDPAPPPAREPAVDTPSDAPAEQPASPLSDRPSREEIGLQFAGVEPAEWGEDLEGILTVLPTQDKVVALTFDACGGGASSAYDEELIEFLIQEQIPATLFISGMWIEDNLGKLDYLAAQQNLEIENHGFWHKPLSVNGREVYGVKGTASPEEVFDEIEENAQRIEQITGRRPEFFRAGTAFYDDVAVRIAGELGVRIAGYTIAADGGATFSKEQILAVGSNPPPGAIFLFHMNHPESNTYQGLQSLYSALVEKGYSFAKMTDY